MSLNTILATTPLTSTNYVLKATGTTIGNSLIFDNGTNVGIGNTNTSYTLDVSGTGRFTSTLLVSGAATFNTSVNITKSQTDNTNTLVLSNSSTTGAVAAAGMSLQSYNGTSTVDVLTLSATGNSWSYQAYGANAGVVYAGGTGGLDLMAGNASGAIKFFTAGDGTGNQRMTITSAGNVGIGQNSPSYLLDIKAGATPLRIVNTIATSNQQAWIKLRQSDSSNFGADIGIDTTTGGDFVIGRNDGTDTFTEAFRIKRSNGNVGIGASSPASKLEITSTNQGNSVTYGSIYNISQATAINDRLNINFAQNGNQERARAGIGAVAELANGYASSLAFYTRYAIDSSALATTDERMRITSVGAVMVGTSSAVNVKGLFVGGTSSSYINLYSNYSGGAAGMNITNSADVTKVEFFGSSGNYYFAGSNISDRRAKSNIQEITVGLSKISLLKPSTFTYDKNPDIVKGGFIAQEVAEIIPEFVTIPEDENEMMGVDYFGILALAVKAIQELKAQIEQLSKQNEELSNRLIKLESK